MAERGLLPDVLLRAGIRHLCARRLREELLDGTDRQAQLYQQRIDALRHSPVAIHTEDTNCLPLFFGNAWGHD
jgi:cyclopropane-fatty-acyl-phospholipid synthase